MYFLSKSTLWLTFGLSFSPLPSILVLRQDIHFGFLKLLAYLLRPQCQTLSYLHFVTEQRLSTAVWVMNGPSPRAVVCVARCLVCNHSTPHLPLQGDRAGRSVSTSWLPFLYYSSGLDNWQDVYQVMSNMLSPRAPNLLFGCCCPIINISYQGKRSP